LVAALLFMGVAVFEWEQVNKVMVYE